MGGYQNNLIAAMVVFMVLDTLAMAARVYVRTRMLTRGFGLDDVFLLLTYVCFIISCAMGFTSLHYGMAAPDKQPWYNDAERLRFLSANQLCLYIGAGLVKIAVALVLYRLASTKRLRWTLIGSIVVVTIWTVVMTVFASGPCAQSGASNWAGSKACSQIGYFRTVSNIFIDWFYALLPIVMLWKVHMSIRIKISVMLLLGLGFFASSATFVKLYIIVRLVEAKGAEAADLHNGLLLWADIELGMAIFAAAVAGIRPLLSKYAPAIWGRSTPAPDSHGAGSEATGPYSALGASSEMTPIGKDRTGVSGVERQVDVV